MSQKIFREKSLERVNSPERLDEYLKVTSPSVWIILIGIITVLVGVIVWGSVGKINTYVPTSCVVTNGTAACYVKQEDIDKIENNMELKIGDDITNIFSISKEGCLIEEDVYLRHLINIEKEDYVFETKAKTNVADGYYQANIVVESISPMKFILN